MFDLEEVEAGLTGTGFAGQVKHFPSVHSTNTLALEAAQVGGRTGVWVADEQTAGRGRGGHLWHSIVGDGLYMSVLIAPALPVSKALWISLATGLATQQAIREVTGLRADIRWPNDLLIDGKKCCGILVETAVAQTDAEAVLRYAVIGIGINLNHASFPGEIAPLATSLHLEGGQNVPREIILVALLRALDRELKLLSQPNTENLLNRFSNASSWVSGRRVQVSEQGGYTGVTAGLNARGFLLVNCDDGTQRTVLSGGVR